MTTERWEDQPNIAMDAVIEAFAYRARLGAEVRIWQHVEMPMSKPGYRDLDLTECPDEIGHHETDGNIVWLRIETGWDRDTMLEDELMEYLAKQPSKWRFKLLGDAQNIAPKTTVSRERYVTLATIMLQPHEATAAAMERARREKEGS